MTTSTRRPALLAGLLVAFLFLTGCGGGDDEATAPGADDATEAAAGDTGVDADEPGDEAGGQPEGEPIRIGVMNPFSGAFALYGEELYRGYELATQAANEAGGVLGRPVELLRGDALTPDDGIAEAERLATRENVDLFVGTYVSAVSSAASEVAAQYDKVYWDTNAVAIDLTQRGLDNFIRVGPDGADFAARSAEMVVEAFPDLLGEPAEEITVWLEHEESIYGTSIAERQQELLEAAGVEVLGVGAHNAGAADLTDSILRAQEANPDVWIQTGYVSDTNLLHSTMRDQGFSPPVVMTVGSGDTFETVEALGAEYLEGVLVVSYPRADISEDYGPGSDVFLEAYVDAYGEEPIAPQSLSAYTGMVVLFGVIEDAGALDPQSIRDAAAAMDVPLNSLPNGFGVLFNEDFDNERTPFTVIQYQGGQQVTVYPPEAAAAEITNIPRS